MVILARGGSITKRWREWISSSAVNGRMCASPAARAGGLRIPSWVALMFTWKWTLSARHLAEDRLELAGAALEDLQQRRVELPLRRLHHQLQRCLVRQRRLPAPPAPQSIVHIRYRHQPRRQRDGVAGQPVGIARPIIFLVV